MHIQEVETLQHMVAQWKLRRLSFGPRGAWSAGADTKASVLPV